MDQIRSILLFAKSIVTVQHNPKEIQSVADEVNTLRERHPEDFTIAKYYVKTQLGYISHQQIALQQDDPLQLMFEEYQLKEMLKKAREVADLQLVSRHNYTKYEKHVDFFELSRCSNYLSLLEFEDMCEKYAVKYGSSYAMF